MRMKVKLDMKFIFVSGFFVSLIRFIPEISIMLLIGSISLNPESPMFMFSFLITLSTFVGYLLQAFGLAAAYQLFFPSIPGKGLRKGINYGIIMWFIIGLPMIASIFYPFQFPEMTFSEIVLAKFFDVISTILFLVYFILQGIVLQFFITKFSKTRQ